jgi:preprotein translocase subunit YajC
MTWNFANALMAQAAPSRPGEGIWTMLPMILIMVALFFFMTSSQRKRAKQHEALVKSIKAGDKITTSGGIIGIVVTVKDKSVSIRSADTKLEVLKSAIAEITEREGEPSAAAS